MAAIPRPKTLLKCALLVAALLLIAGSSAFLLYRQKPIAAVNLPAEYEPVSHLVMTHQVFLDGYGGLSLARAVLAAGARVIIASTLSGTSALERQAWLTSLGFNEEESIRINVAEVLTDSPWIRDFGPIPVRQGAAVNLIDPIYPQADGSDDAFGPALAQALGKASTKMALLFDGGNLLSDGERCYMSAPLKDAPLHLDGVASTDAASVVAAELRARMGCKDVIFIAAPPHEHIDMYAKIVRHDTVMVGQIEETTLAMFRDDEGNLPLDYEALQKSLDDAAAQFAKYLNVVRIPQPVPFRGVMPNYANALIVNGTAIVPSYDRYGLSYDDYPDRTLKAFYEQRVLDEYSKLGFKVVFVNADALIRGGGALHCVTMQIPQAKVL